MPEDEYRALPAISNSDLLKWVSASTIEPKVADFGSAFHAIINDPASAKAKIVALAPREKYVPHEGKYVMVASDYVKLKGMYQAIAEHPVWSKLMHASREKPDNCEAALVWVHEPTGITLKARIDFFTDDWLYDFKSTGSDPDGFGECIAAFGYAQQAAMYLAGAQACGLTARGFRFACSSKRPDKGHVCWIEEVSETDLRHGRKSMETLLTLYKRYEHENV